MRPHRADIFLVLVLSLSAAVGRLGAEPLPQPDADNGGLTLPSGFHALIVADNIGKARFITVAPSGDLYVKRFDNGLVALHDSNGSGRADVISPFGSGAGTGIAVYKNHLYYSTNDAVYRYPLVNGQLVPQGEPEPIVTGLPPGQHQHEAKSFFFDNHGSLYVEVGCPTNASADPDRALGAKGIDPTELFKQHGGFWRFKDQTPNQDQLKDGHRYCTGFRHVLSALWNPISEAMFIVQMGRDQLNTVDPVHFSAEQNAICPAEELHIVHDGSVFGWPYTYFDFPTKTRRLAPEWGGDGILEPEKGKYPDPLVAFPAHWAPLQMTLYTGTQFPEKYRNGAFVAFHGSWNRAPLPQAGYNITFVPFDAKGMPAGSYEVFADNFAGIPLIKSPKDALCRPCGIAMGPDGSLYVTDDKKGRVWRIFYTGS